MEQILNFRFCEYLTFGKLWSAEGLARGRVDSSTRTYSFWRRPMSEQLPTQNNEQPLWDGQAMTFSYRGQILKRFTNRAINQTRLLDAFQNAGWPHEIRSPFHDQEYSTGVRAPQRKKEHDGRLNSTLHELNESLRPVHFGRSRERVRWSIPRDDEQMLPDLTTPARPGLRFYSSGWRTGATKSAAFSGR
jgi:hypothetical protein